MKNMDNNDLIHYIANAERKVNECDPEEAFRIYREGLKKSMEAGDTDNEYLIRCGIADTYLKMQDYKKVVKECKDSIKRQKKTGDMDFMARNLSQLGYACQMLGQSDLAKNHIRESFRLLPEIHDPYIAGDILFFSSLYYSKVGDFEKSLNYALSNLEIAKKAHLSSKKFGIYGMIAEIYLQMGNNERALDYAFHQLKFTEVHKAVHLKPLALTNIAGIYIEMEKDEKAIDYYDKAFECYADQGMYLHAVDLLQFFMDELLPEEERESMIDEELIHELLSVAPAEIVDQALFPTWSACMFLAGNFKKAEYWLKKTLESMEKSPQDSFQKAPILFQMAMINVEQNKFKKAIKNFRKTLELLGDDDDSEVMRAFIHGQLGMLYVGMNKLDDAKTEYEKAIKHGKRQNIPGLEALTLQYNELLENMDPGLFDI